MTREQLKELTSQGVVLLDGATGTNLMEAGMPIGVCPEAWILEHPEVMEQLQKDMIAAMKAKDKTRKDAISALVSACVL